MIIPTHPTGGRRRSRATTFLLTVVLAAASTLTACAFDDSLLSGGSGHRPSPVTFDTPLPIPPLAESTVEDGVRVFSLTAQEGQQRFIDDLTTPTWGYNGAFLGPTLRAERGERVAVEVHNELPETTSVHWHGMHLPAAMDGGPHQPIEPGGSWRPEWRIDQQAATLWYHPHPHGDTEEHVLRGLAGMFLIDDERSGAFGLPGEYGVDDVPVIVQDRRFRSDGQFELDSQGNEVGLLGDVILTNGARGSVFDVTTEAVRLRLLNGSSARTYDFVVGEREPFALAATDGGLLDAPVRTDHVRLSPGERAEIVVELAPGTERMLRSIPPDLGNVVVPAAYGGTQEFDVMLLRAASTLRPSSPLAAQFDAVERYSPAEADATRRFEVQNREINGRRMDMGRIDEVMRLNTTEVWEVTNRDLFPHNWHVHDVQFQVVDIDGEQPPPELRGRKDTIYLEPRRVYRIIMRFEDYADEHNPYMIHCHLLLHEDEGLMSQFVVRSG